MAALIPSLGFRKECWRRAAAHFAAARAAAACAPLRSELICAVSVSCESTEFSSAYRRVAAWAVGPSRDPGGVGCGGWRG